LSAMDHVKDDDLPGNDRIGQDVWGARHDQFPRFVDSARAANFRCCRQSEDSRKNALPHPDSRFAVMLRNVALRHLKVFTRPATPSYIHTRWTGSGGGSSLLVPHDFTQRSISACGMPAVPDLASSRDSLIRAICHALRSTYELMASPARYALLRLVSRARPSSLLLISKGIRTVMVVSFDKFELFCCIYPAQAIIRNSVGFMIRKLSVTSSHHSRQFAGTSSRRKVSIAILKSLNVA